MLTTLWLGQNLSSCGVLSKGPTITPELIEKAYDYCKKLPCQSSVDEKNNRCCPLTALAEFLGGDICSIYDPEMLEDFCDTMEGDGDLPEAIAVRDHLESLYGPIPSCFGNVSSKIKEEEDEPIG